MCNSHDAPFPFFIAARLMSNFLLLFYCSHILAVADALLDFQTTRDTTVR